MEQKNNKVIQEHEVSDLSLFKTLSRHSLAFKSLLRRCTRKVFSPSSLICEKGSPVDGIYIIEEGEVSIKAEPKSADPSGHSAETEYKASQRGEIIGESDVHSKRRTITMKACTRTKVILIPNQIYHFLTQKLSGQSSCENNIPIFTHLTTAAVHQLYQNSIRKSYCIRNVIYDIGDEVSFVYMVVSGELKIEDEKNTVFKLTPGSFFGFEDIVSMEMVRQYKVVCDSAEGIIIEFKRETFEEFCMGHEKVMLELRLIMDERKSSYLRPIDAPKVDSMCQLDENTYYKTELTEDKKEIVRSNRVFKNIDREYRMIHAIKKYQKQVPISMNTVPEPWFKNSDKKMKMRIQQMESKVGIGQAKKKVGAPTSHHSATKQLLKQLNYDPEEPRPSSQLRKYFPTDC